MSECTALFGWDGVVWLFVVVEVREGVTIGSARWLGHACIVCVCVEGGWVGGWECRGQ